MTSDSGRSWQLREVLLMPRLKSVRKVRCGYLAALREWSRRAMDHSGIEHCLRMLCQRPLLLRAMLVVGCAGPRAEVSSSVPKNAQFVVERLPVDHSTGPSSTATATAVFNCTGIHRAIVNGAISCCRATTGQSAGKLHCGRTSCGRSNGALGRRRAAQQPSTGKHSGSPAGNDAGVFTSAQRVAARTFGPDERRRSARHDVDPLGCREPGIPPTAAAEGLSGKHPSGAGTLRISPSLRFYLRSARATAWAASISMSADSRFRSEERAGSRFCRLASHFPSASIFIPITSWLS